MAARRSDCSTLVGSPVLGPPRWTSTTTRGNLRHDGQAEHFGLQGQPGPGRDGEGALAGPGGPDRHAGRRNLVLGLMKKTSELQEDLTQVVGNGGGRGDGVHGRQVHTGGHTPHGDGLVPVHHHVGPVVSRGGHGETEVQVFDSPREARIQELHIPVGDGLLLLPEGVGDLGSSDLEIPVVDVTENAQDPHVLTPPGVVHDLETFLFHGNLDDPVVRTGEFLHGVDPLLLDVLVLVGLPHVLEEDHGVVFQGPEPVPGQENLFVQGHDDGGFVSPVCDGDRSDPDSVPARASRKSWGAAGLRPE